MKSLPLWLALVLAAALPAAHAGTPVVDAKELVHLAVDLESRPVRQCLVTATLGYNAFFAFYATRTPPDKVRRYLMATPGDATARARDEKYLAAWERDMSPETIAGLKLEDCLSDLDMPLVSKDVLRGCFSLNAPMVHTLAMKQQGRTPAATREELQKFFGQQLAPDFLDGVLKNVYEAPNREAELGYEIGNFLACVKQGAD